MGGSLWPLLASGGSGDPVCWLVGASLLTYLLWLCGVFVAAQAFSPCGERGLLTAGSALVADTGPRAHGLQQLWLPGSAALQQVGSSQAKDRTPVPSIVRRNLNHWTSIAAGSLSISRWLSPLCVSVSSLSLVKCTCHCV